MHVYPKNHKSERESELAIVPLSDQNITIKPGSGFDSLSRTFSYFYIHEAVRIDWALGKKLNKDLIKDF